MVSLITKYSDETPELGDQPITVHITILEEDLSSENVFRGKKMAEILEKLSASPTFAEVDPIA
ncbi:hypothetical protein GS682_19090 [Nostoc sp. B(2019)]|nr:hypothetical protein [Nostoc sp. B(2019)]